MLRCWIACVFSLLPLCAQTPCNGTPAFSPCEFTFQLTAADAAAYPNPYTSIDLNIEFRSPRFRTYRMPAFWDGGNKLAVRFAPTEAGSWTYRISSNLKSLDGKEGTFNAAESGAPGYVHEANVHHWQTDDKKAHLWMGFVIDNFGFMPAAELDKQLASVQANKFNHVRVSILGTPAEQRQAYGAPDSPNTAYFDELDRRILSVHQRGITTDIMFAADPDALVKLFPDAQSRRRFVRYVVARYGALNVTWQGVEEFEGHANARAILKELGLAIKDLDPYQHPRSTNAKITSAPFLGDGWMTFIIDHSGDDQLGSIEHQFYQVPFVGVIQARRIWSATMDGQYPTIEGDPGGQPRYWFEFMSGTRHWELEPYFDVDEARAVALEDAEYVIYVEKPGPIEAEVEKHGYDVTWFNPITGQMDEAKKYKGEHFTGQEPDNSHPWVLLLARESHVEAMNRSYRFASRDVPVQVIETSAEKVPYAIAEPAGGSISESGPVKFSAKLTRHTRATRRMMYLWTADVPTESQGFRILGTGAEGSFRIPPGLATRFPAVLSIRLMSLNANGKAYSADKVCQLNP